MSNGALIRPQGIKDYNDRRRQEFECLCGLLSDFFMFIVTITVGNETWAICDFCGYSGMSSVIEVS